MFLNPGAISWRDLALLRKNLQCDHKYVYLYVCVCVCVCVYIHIYIFLPIFTKKITVIYQNNKHWGRIPPRYSEDVWIQDFIPETQNATIALLEYSHVETRWWYMSVQPMFFCFECSDSQTNLEVISLNPYPQYITTFQENQAVSHWQVYYILLFLSWQGDE